MDLADQKKLMSCIAADLKMIAVKTELIDMDECEKRIYDFNVCLKNDYLEAISIVIENGDNIPIRAKKYIIQNNPNQQKSDRPGNNNWDEVQGTKLRCVISYSDKWNELDSAEKEKIKRKLKISWSLSNLDTDFPDLDGQIDKQYTTSNASVHRTSYE